MKLRILLTIAGLNLSVAAQIAPTQEPIPSNISRSPIKASSSIKAWKVTYGTWDQAAVMSVTAGSATEPPTQVLGFKDPSELSTYSNRDSVALYAANIPSAPLVTTANTTFTANSVTSADFAAIRSNLQVGMIIDAHPGKTHLSGMIVSWSGNTITVSNWYVVDGSRNTGTPANGSVVRVNPATKVWAANLLLEIPESATATNSGSGLEIGVLAYKPAVAQGVVAEDLANLGPSAVLAMSQARGAANYGYYSQTGKTWAYRSDLGRETNFMAYQDGTLPGARVNYWSYPYQGATSGAKYGFRSTRDQAGFTAENPTVSAYTASIDGNARFNVNTLGQIDGSYFHYEPINQPNMMLTQQSVYVVNTYNGATVGLPSASTLGAGKVITLVAHAPCTANGVPLSANQTITWISDGAKWITVNFGSAAPPGARGQAISKRDSGNGLPTACREYPCTTATTAKRAPVLYRSGSVSSARDQVVSTHEAWNGLPIRCKQYPCIMAKVEPTLYRGTDGIGANTIYTAPSSGLYRECAFVRTTVAGTAGTFQLKSSSYVSDGSTAGSSEGITPATSATIVGSIGRACIDIYVDSGSPIQWALSASGVTGSPTVRYALTLERLQ
jgi:hypothetical protein